MRETTKGCDVLHDGLLWLRIGVPTALVLELDFLYDYQAKLVDVESSNTIVI